MKPGSHNCPLLGSNLNLHDQPTSLLTPNLELVCICQPTPTLFHMDPNDQDMSHNALQNAYFRLVDPWPSACWWREACVWLMGVTGRSYQAICFGGSYSTLHKDLGSLEAHETINISWSHYHISVHMA